MESFSEIRDKEIQALLNEYGLTKDNMFSRGYYLLLQQRDGRDIAILAKHEKVLPLTMLGTHLNVNGRHEGRTQ